MSRQVPRLADSRAHRYLAEYRVSGLQNPDTGDQPNGDLRICTGCSDTCRECTGGAHARPITNECKRQAKNVCVSRVSGWAFVSA